jgi:hypothetical protein
MGFIRLKPLDVYAPKTKTLGAWEVKEVKSGGVFVQTGVYLLRYKPLKETYDDRDDEHAHFKVKTRGFSPKEIDHAEGTSYNQAVSEVLGRDIPQYWLAVKKPTISPIATIWLWGLALSAVTHGNASANGKRNRDP